MKLRFQAAKFFNNEMFYKQFFYKKTSNKVAEPCLGF